MGGHKVTTPKVPDWRIYKVEDVPELVTLRKALASHPLKLRDPWIRNHVWKFVEFKDQTLLIAGKKILFSGFKIGLVAALITTGIEMALSRGHGNHGKEEHH